MQCHYRTLTLHAFETMGWISIHIRISEDVNSAIPETVFFLALLLAFVPTGNGSVASVPKVNLRGAGATFPKAVYTEWINYYRSSRHNYVNLNMTYTARGSTYGKQAIMGETDVEVEYAGTDYTLTPAQEVRYPDLKLLPTMAGAVVFGYNLGRITNNSTLILSMELAVGIYNGTYRYWNDSNLKILNPNITFPDEKIVVIARGDSSGTTHTITTAFSTIPGWKAKYGIFAKGHMWSKESVTYLAKTNRGMSGLIMSFEYSIGYLVVADALEAGLPFAKMANQYGMVVSPSRESVQLAMDQASKSMTTDLSVELSNHQHRESYPIASFTYMMVRMRTMKNCNSARELARYINWFTSDEKAIKACADKYMVPVSASIKNRIEKLILYRLQCNGKDVWESVQQEMEDEEEEYTKVWFLPTVVGVTMLATVALGITAYVTVRRIQTNRALDSNEWAIPIEDIVFYTTAKGSSGNSRFVMWSSIRSLTDIDELEDGYQMVKHILQWPGKWNSQNVGLRLLEIKDLLKVKRATGELLLFMKDSIIHNNVLNFYGLTELQNDRYVVSDYCSKGPLSDLLKDNKYLFNKSCKFSLTLEMISGLAFLHSKGIIHGHLHTSSCLVDFKWTVKIVDWEYCHLYSHLYPKKNPLISVRKTADEVGKEKAAFLDFWTAPELLRSGNSVHPTAACDIYSCGIIIQEVFTRKDPYAEFLDTMEPSELLKAILGNNLRPSHGEETPMSIRQIMEYAWSEIPSSRPSSEQILKMLRNSNNLKKSVLDHMVEASEEYTLSLEEKLKHKSEKLAESESDISALIDRNIPSHLQQKLHDAVGSNIVDLTSSVCVIAICALTKAKQYDRKRKGSGSFTSWLEQIDSQLTELAARYSAFLINYTSGVYIIIYGVGVKEKRKAIQAARMVFEFLAEESHPIATSSRESLMNPSYKCAIHFGSVYTGLLERPFPKCHIVGDVIHETYKLLNFAQPSKVLITNAYKEALTIFALDYFWLEANRENVHENGLVSPGETYWLHRKPNTEYPRWSAVMSSNRFRRRSSEAEHKLQSRSSRTRSRIGSEEELPVTHITSLLRNQPPGGYDVNSHKRLTASVSLPPGMHTNWSNPWNSIAGKLSRSKSLTTGTIATLRHFLRRTLPAAPSYKMNVISSNDERKSDVSSDEPTLDSLPV